MPYWTPPREFDTQWMRVKETADKIITLKNVPRQEWNDRFSDVHDLCMFFTNTKEIKLYDKIEEYLEQHVRHIERLIETSEGSIIAVYYNYWTIYSEGLSYLNNLFSVLNKQFVLDRDFQRNIWHYRKQEILEVKQLGFEIWKQFIRRMKFRLAPPLVNGVQLDRCNQCPDPSLIRDVIQSLTQVDKYNPDKLKTYQFVFEEPFLKCTEEFYNSKFSRLVGGDFSDYMKTVIQTLEEEKLRCQKFLHSTSTKKVILKCQKRMVADYLQFFYENCREMILKEDEKDLDHLYFLMSPHPEGVEFLLEELHNHISRKSFEVIKSIRGQNAHRVYVENLIEKHEKYRQIIKTVLSNDPKFIFALDKAFADIISPEHTKPKYHAPELLAKYWDFLLKKRAKMFSENEIECKLNKSMIFFKYIADKDHFREFCARMLAQRIISGQSMSVDIEEAAINTLKQECGSGYIKKLHRILTDSKISKGFGSTFTEYLSEENIELKFNFQINVFQMGSWPIEKSPVTSFAIPQELELCIQKFDSFYKSSFNGRRLTWLHHLSSAELKLCYLKKHYIVTMSTFQLAILLLFEKADEISYTEILENTKLNEDELSEQIKVFLLSQLILDTKPLFICDPDRTIDPGSTYILNKEYVNSKTKFAMKSTRKKTAQQEVVKTREVVEEDRKHYLEATIVRIMKDRKTLHHAHLIQEVYSQANNHFVPNVQNIKKCIDALIEREYIARNPDYTSEYYYIA